MKHCLFRIDFCGQVFFMRNKRNDLSALTLAAVGLSADFCSGRAMAAFYAQLGQMSWLGVGVSSLLFGACIALLSHIALRTGARNMRQALRRASGGGGARLAQILYAALLAGGMAMCLLTAAQVGRLALPFRHASAEAALVCALLAAALAVRENAFMKWSAAFLLCMVAFALALLFFGSLPKRAMLNWSIDLQLKNMPLVAILFALLHGAMSACLAAGAAVRITDGRVRPPALGLRSGMVYFLLLALANGVLQSREEALLALKLPFVALSSGWGKGGFYLSAGMIFLSSVTTAAGLLYAVFPQHKCPDFIEK